MPVRPEGSVVESAYAFEYGERDDVY